MIVNFQLTRFEPPPYRWGLFSEKTAILILVFMFLFGCRENGNDNTNEIPQAGETLPGDSETLPNDSSESPDSLSTNTNEIVLSDCEKARDAYKKAYKRWSDASASVAKHFGLSTLVLDGKIIEELKEEFDRTEAEYKKFKPHWYSGFFTATRKTNYCDKGDE